MTAAEKIRRLLSRDTLLMPGVFDALSARIACDAGFEVIFISGYSVSAVTLAEPDFGYISLPDIAEAARRVCGVAGENVPVIVDADTGFGGSMNVERTIVELEGWLNRVAVEHMTAALLAERDPGGELLGYLQAITALASRV